MHQPEFEPVPSYYQSATFALSYRAHVGKNRFFRDFWGTTQPKVDQMAPFLARRGLPPRWTFLPNFSEIGPQAAEICVTDGARRAAPGARRPARGARRTADGTHPTKRGWVKTTFARLRRAKQFNKTCFFLASDAEFKPRPSQFCFRG